MRREELIGELVKMFYATDPREAEKMLQFIEQAGWRPPKELCDKDPDWEKEP